MDVKIGTFEAIEPSHREMRLTLLPATFAIPWAQSSATSTFAADYFQRVSRCGGRVTDPIDKAQFHGSISYVLNELLENALKFHQGDEPITLELGLRDDALLFAIANTIAHKDAEALPAIFTPLVEGDPIDLFMERVEANAESDSGDESGLGFLTMQMDYEVTLGWWLHTSEQHTDFVRVTTLAQLPIG